MTTTADPNGNPITTTTAPATPPAASVLTDTEKLAIKVQALEKALAEKDAAFQTLQGTYTEKEKYITRLESGWEEKFKAEYEAAPEFVKTALKDLQGAAYDKYLKLNQEVARYKEIAKIEREKAIAEAEAAIKAKSGVVLGSLFDRQQVISGTPPITDPSKPAAGTPAGNPQPSSNMMLSSKNWFDRVKPN